MKNTFVGTCHFTSIQRAVKYYAPYGQTKKDVLGKIERAEIMIGPPPPKAGERITISEDGQYVVIL